MKIYKTIDEPDILLLDKDGNIIAKCHTATIETTIVDEYIKGGEGEPLIVKIPY